MLGLILILRRFVCAVGVCRVTDVCQECTICPSHNHSARDRLRKVYTRIPASDRGWSKVCEVCQGDYPGTGSLYGGRS